MRNDGAVPTHDKTSAPPGAVVITGGAQGIGRAVAESVAAAGHPVALLDLQDAVTTTAAEIEAAAGTLARGYAVDVTDGRLVEEAARAVAADFGGVYGLVNNAGRLTASYDLVEDIAESDFDSLVSTHVKGSFLCSSKFMPMMKTNKRGRIVFISSLVGPLGYRRRLPYATAKSAVLGMMRSLAAEGGPFNVTANSVNPGYIYTDAFASRVAAGDIEADKLLQRIPVGRFGSGDDVAKIIVSLLSPSFDYVTGTELWVDGGYHMMGDVS